MAVNRDIVAMFEQGNESNEIVGKLIKSDYYNPEKAFMRKADKYYNNNNDVLDIDFTAYVVDGIPKTNDNRSNYHLCHNFFQLLVNQAANYIAGNPINYKIDDDAFQSYLDDYLMFDFNDNNIKWLTDARKKGRSYLHVYYDKDGSLNYAVIPAEQIIPIYTDEFSKKLQSIIRYYNVPGTDSKGNYIERKKAEWWDSEKVSIFQEDEKGNFDFYYVNELAHWLTSITTTPDIEESHSWGKVPFIQLFNNDTATSDLQNIKGFIDAYDITESEFINQIADIREILIKILGYGKQDANEILQAFRGTGIVKIDDPDGNIDILKTEIPVEARQAALKSLKDNIFMIGQGVDTNPEKIGTNVSGIALKMLYGALDLKCSPSIRKMHKALYEFMWFIADDYNRTYRAAINYKDIKFTFNKNLIMNDAEIVESLMKSKGVISDKTIISKHPYVDNPRVEEKLMEEQEKKEAEEFDKQITSSNPTAGNKE